MQELKPAPTAQRREIVPCLSNKEEGVGSLNPNAAHIRLTQGHLSLRHYMSCAFSHYIQIYDMLLLLRDDSTLRKTKFIHSIISLKQYSQNLEMKLENITKIEIAATWAVQNQMLQMAKTVNKICTYLMEPPEPPFANVHVGKYQTSRDRSQCQLQRHYERTKSHH